MGESMAGPALAGALDAYRDAPAGTVLPRFATMVDAARQATYHRCCDVAADSFGSVADVTILAQDNSRATTLAGLPNDGRIHTRHVIRQNRPLRIGEAVACTGRLAGYRAARRGRLLTCLFAFMAQDGSLPLEMETEYLLPFADAAAGPAAAPPIHPAGSSDDDPEMVEAARLVLTPDKVTAFSEEVGNAVHFDPAFARARGFRAPLAQGLMQLTAMHGALVAGCGTPRQLALEVRFLRPVFWDAGLQVLRDPGYTRLMCRDAAGRITARLSVSRLSFQEGPR